MRNMVLVVLAIVLACGTCGCFDRAFLRIGAVPVRSKPADAAPEAQPAKLIVQYAIRY
jgi:hypothetical protein